MWPVTILTTGSEHTHTHKKRQPITLLLIPASIIQRSVREWYLSPTILSLQFVSLTAGETVTSSIGPETGGGHIATDINKRLHLFLQPQPRLAEALPRAIRYFPMNYISELKMKGLCAEPKTYSCGTTREPDSI